MGGLTVKGENSPFRQYCKFGQECIRLKLIVTLFVLLEEMLRAHFLILYIYVTYEYSFVFIAFHLSLCDKIFDTVLLSIFKLEYTSLKWFAISRCFLLSFAFDHSQI